MLSHLTIKNVSGTYFDRDSAARNLYEYLWMFPLVAILYALIIHFQKSLLKRKFNVSGQILDQFLLLWNALNGAFNAYLVVSLLPEFLETSTKEGWFSIVCNEDELYVRKYSGSALYMFCWSKLWLIGDTIFLILRNCPITFLHAFHHAAVMNQAVFGYFYIGALMRLGVLLNCTISTAVYVYLVAQSIDNSNRRFGAYIVIGQIAQIVIGIFAILSVFYYQMFSGVMNFFNYSNLHQKQCQPASSDIILLANLGFYLAFLYLFCNFFYENFLKNRKNFLRSSKIFRKIQCKKS